jgi:uncharacterized membrane protein YfcA
MSYTLGELAVIAGVMTLGSVMQGALGFASGLLGVPLLVLCNFSLLDATIINFVSTLVQNVAGAVQLRRTLERRDWFAPIMWRFAGLPLGIQTLDRMQSVEPAHVKQVIGAVLLSAVVTLMGLRVKPRDHLHWSWTALAFLTSGFLMGLAAIGGAPMVLYVNSLTWPADKSRGFLFFCSAALTPAMAVLLAWKFGAEAKDPLIAAIVILPLTLCGLWAGLRAGERLDKRLFRRLTYGLLLVFAVGALASPVIEGMLFKRR